MAKARQGAKAAGRPRASIASVAERAGVSIATVSRVLNGVANKATAETVERVRRAVAELGYRPVSAGQALRNRQSRLVALLAANLANPAMAAIAASAEVALREQGLVMILCDTHDRPDLQDEYLKEMQAHLVRGTVLLGAVESRELRALREAGEPLLFVGRRAPGDGAAPYIGIDNGAAAREVAEHLMARNCRTVAMIHGPLTSSATADRVAAFQAAFRTAGRPLPASRIVTASGIDHLQIGYTAMQRLLQGRARPDALFCASDLIAYGAHRRAAEEGIAGEMTFVGFDDSPLNPWVAPWLSSIQVPYGEFGRAIVASLATLWAGEIPKDLVLAHRFVRRP